MLLAEIDQLLPCLKDDKKRSPPLTCLWMEQGIDAQRAGDFAAAEKLLRDAETEALLTHRWGIALLSDIVANLGSVYSARADGWRMLRTKLKEAGLRSTAGTTTNAPLPAILNILAF